jgi:hypothetical protein
MMNFIDPAKRKSRATTIWAAQSKRLMVLVLELNMVGSPLVSAALAPEGFERLAAFTNTSNERTRNRHGDEKSLAPGPATGRGQSDDRLSAANVRQTDSTMTLRFPAEKDIFVLVERRSDATKSKND